MLDPSPFVGSVVRPLLRLVRPRLCTTGGASNAAVACAATVNAMRHELEIAHLSDTHLGRKQYPVNAVSGHNQREQDFSRATLSNVVDIVEWDPALVVHSGDYFDNSRPSWRHMMQGQDAATKLAGNGRLLVIAGGNHDQPADATEPCALELYNALPNVIVATNKYVVVDLSARVAAGTIRPELEDVVIHLMPHEALKSAVWDEVQPWEGKTNILVSHCVVGGSELYKRSIGREYSLPIDVITRGWDYVALGHYHKQGPVAVGGYTDATTPAWYAGSTENNGYSDVKDNKTSGGRGYLRVNISPDRKVPAVVPRDLPIRSMFRLPVIDAEGLGHQEILDLMKLNVTKAKVDGAVVRQVVQNVHADVWSLVDISAARALATDALWYDPKPEFVTFTPSADAATEDTSRLGDLGAVLSDVLAETMAEDPQAAAVEDLARRLLGDALDGPAAAEGDDCCAATQTEHEHPEDDNAAQRPAA